jgi:hypothetical protein
MSTTDTSNPGGALRPRWFTVFVLLAVGAALVAGLRRDAADLVPAMGFAGAGFLAWFAENFERWERREPADRRKARPEGFYERHRRGFVGCAVVLAGCMIVLRFLPHAIACAWMVTK